MHINNWQRDEAKCGFEFVYFRFDFRGFLYSNGLTERNGVSNLGSKLSHTSILPIYLGFKAAYFAVKALRTSIMFVEAS